MSSKTSDQSAHTASILKNDITKNNTPSNSNININNNNTNFHATAKTAKDDNKENVPTLEQGITAFQIFKRKSASSLKSSRTSGNCIKKKIFKSDLLKQDPKRKLQLQQRFASPTDRLVSPCSLKLNEHKVKMFGKRQKVNPMKLNFKGPLATDSEDVEIDEDEEFFY
ncbi:spo12p [Saccharomyces arboricola H-6]|uniref:Spo12p n=1 Tax=Saccharomyces arboricola (strain H-6 / AS 2.3317 / CBS 10644) TaxID=1160507 RepID=J8PMN1_SACAR|nr:spo12p [Saccharomyces arboricola H-6]